jgi:DNA-binding XRE family transcriptional regulator
MTPRPKTAEELRVELATLRERYEMLAADVRDAIDQVEAGVTPKLVMRRLATKVSFAAGRRWTKDDIIAKAWEWFHRYDETPAASSWSPAQLKSKDPDPKVLERWLDGEWPGTTTVVRRFDGSWNKMLDAAGLPHNAHSRGAKRAVNDHAGLPLWTGWDLIEGFRSRAGIPSQAELARRANVSVGTVRGLETGAKDNPTLRVFLAIAVALHVPPAAMLDHTAPEPEIS